MTLAILILALIVATCIIAYIADNIGKNLGKKRISIMGLRPRQTATLISMATSVAIMLLTVAILMLTSASLRNALLRYDAEKKEANRRQREITKLQAEKDELLKNVQLQREQNNAQLKELERNRNLAAQFMKQRVEAEHQLKRASVRLTTARKGEAGARARAREAQAQLTQARKQFENFKKQLADAKLRVAAAQVRVQQAQAQVRNVEAQFKAEQERVASTVARLANAQQKLADAQQQLGDAQRKQRVADEQLTAKQAQLTETESNFERVQEEVRKNLEEIAKTMDELASLEKQIKDYKEIAAGEIAIQMGEVFAEEVVSPHISTKDALAAIHRLLAAGREKLYESRRTFAIDIPETASQLTEEEFLSRFAAILSTREYPVSLRLTAARDHARGESKIFVRLVPIQIRTVFEKDEVLASAAINAGDEETHIFNRLLALLNENEQRARERGVMPLLTAENPVFYPPGTNVEVFDALRRIQAMGGIVRVRLLAAENISTIDSPRVKFEITRQ